MKIIAITFIFLFLGSVNSYSATREKVFKNEREGTSRYLRPWNNFWLAKKNIVIEDDLYVDFTSNEQLCEENYFLKLEAVYSLKNRNKKYGLLSLRKSNFIDDVAYQKITKYLNSPHSINLEINEQKIEQIEKINHVKILQSLKQFSTYRKKNKCLGESFAQLFSSLTSSKKKKKEREFKKIIKKLYRNKVIQKKTAKRLIKLLKEDIHQNGGKLKSYLYTKNFIKKNIKEENAQDKEKNGLSDFISLKDKINKVYPRQRLYENFNQFQIIYMAQILEKFLFRLENTATLGINLIDDEDIAYETFYIDSPMEIYRFLLKYLRYEMAKLKENHLFVETPVTYSDFLAGSFEMYHIPPIALEELRKMEHIWNPQRSKLEKVITWTKLFTQAGLIFVPPPYNYLASLSMWVIESFVQDNSEQANYGHSIFGEVQ